MAVEYFGHIDVVKILALLLSKSHIAGKKYWKISRVVKVITSKNIGFITSGRRPRVINPIFLQVITLTTSDIFQYFLPAIWE